MGLPITISMISLPKSLKGTVFAVQVGVRLMLALGTDDNPGFKWEFPKIRGTLFGGSL